MPFAQFGVVPELHSPEGGALRETPPTAEELRKLPVVKSVERGQYPPLLRKMDAGGMLAFQEYAPKVINGIFGLPKGDGRIRIIIDMRRGNLYFNPTPKMDMPVQKYAQHVFMSIAPYPVRGATRDLIDFR